MLVGLGLDGSLYARSRHWSLIYQAAHYFICWQKFLCPISQTKSTTESPVIRDGGKGNIMTLQSRSVFASWYFLRISSARATFAYQPPRWNGAKTLIRARLTSYSALNYHTSFDHSRTTTSNRSITTAFCTMMFMIWTRTKQTIKANVEVLLNILSTSLIWRPLNFRLDRRVAINAQP
jgi:hypothetical protein